MFGKPHSFLLAIGAALWCAITLTSAARAAGVTMSVAAYYDGHFKYGEWLPLRVTLANEGAAVRAEIRADIVAAGNQTFYSVPVELPAGARKRVTLYTQPPSFAQGILVQLQAGTQTLATVFVPVVVERNVNYVIGVIAPRRAAFTALRGMTLQTQPAVASDPNNARTNRSVVVLPIPLADIAERGEGLRSLDALIVTDTDTSELSADQRRALQTWVAQGGRLILGGGASAARTLSGLPAEWQAEFQIAAAPTDVNTLDALEKFAAQTIRVPGPFPATFAAGGAPLIAQDGKTWLAEYVLGTGFVDYCALDLAASPFDAWAGALRFWEKLLAPGAAYPADAPVDVSPRAMFASNLAYSLQNLPALALPSLRGLGIWLLAYILLVGPINYLVLARARKLAWGWVTIPALTFLFAAGAFISAASLRGNEVILNQISIVQLDPRIAAAQTFIGIFSPERATYTLQLPAHALPMPLRAETNPFGRSSLAAGSAAEIVEGDPTQLRGIQINQYAMQAFQIETPAPPNWRIESDVRFDGARVRGALANRTDQTLRDAHLVIGNQFVLLGDLAADASLPLDFGLEVARATFPNYLFARTASNPGREGDAIRNAIQTHFRRESNSHSADAAWLIGWMRASPLESKIVERRWSAQQISVVVAPLNVAYTPGVIRLAAGALPLKLLDSTQHVGWCSEPNQVYLNDKSMLAEFRLPKNLAALRVSRLALVLQREKNFPALDFQARDGSWYALRTVTAGANDLADPSRFVLPNGVVRLRASVDSSTGCTQYDLEVEGELP